MFHLSPRTGPISCPPNATLQARGIAGARYERTLFPVACKQLLGRADAEDFTAVPPAGVPPIFRERTPLRQVFQLFHGLVASRTTSSTIWAAGRRRVDRGVRLFIAPDRDKGDHFPPARTR